MKTLIRYQMPILFKLLPGLLLSLILILSACTPTTPPQITQPANPTPPAAQPTSAPASATLAPTVAALPNEKILTTPLPPLNPTKGGNKPMTIEPGLDFLIQQAIADLSQRLNIAPESIQVLEAKSVTWPDGSLGCPQPGMQYIQVLSDGAYILLNADGKDYPYHSGGSRLPFLCEQKFKDPYPPVKIDITKLPPSSPTQDQ